jgi:hypothetical protein
MKRTLLARGDLLSLDISKIHARAGGVPAHSGELKWRS